MAERVEVWGVHTPTDHIKRKEVVRLREKENKSFGQIGKLLKISKNRAYQLYCKMRPKVSTEPESTSMVNNQRTKSAPRVSRAPVTQSLQGK